MLDVAREQSDDSTPVGFMRLERREQLADPRIELRDLCWLAELGGQQVDIAAAHSGDTRLRPRVGVTGQLQQFPHDLRIGLAIESVAIDRAGGAHLVEQGAMDRTPAGTVGPQQGSVDVEEDETHGLKISGFTVWRVGRQALQTA